MIKYVSQKCTADNHVCLFPNSMLLHSMLQFLPKDLWESFYFKNTGLTSVLRKTETFLKKSETLA